MDDRTVEDRLRQEYFELVPHIRRVAEQLEAEIKYHLVPISRQLDPFERLIVKSRIKDCESALESLRRREEGATFNRDRTVPYSLTSLKDLAGVRVLAFPPRLLVEINDILGSTFTSWTADPILEDGHTIAFKYCGFCNASDKVCAEYQIVSMLTGLFWEVEHSAMYKPSPELVGVKRSPIMQDRYQEVLKALSAFEKEFEHSVESAKKNI